MLRGLVNVWVLIACALAGCDPGLPEPNTADAARAETRLGHTDLGELQEGRRLYLARCGSCHALRDPLSLAPDAWVAQVRDMRVNKGAHISTIEETRINAYLVSISLRQVKP